MAVLTPVLFDALLKYMPRGNIWRVETQGTAGPAHDLKLYLTNATPSVGGDEGKADLAEIATGNGYAGSISLNQSIEIASSGGITDTYMTVTPFAIIAVGGTIADFRYFVIYDEDDTVVPDCLGIYWDWGSTLSLDPGDAVVLSWSGDRVLQVGDVF